MIKSFVQDIAWAVLHHKISVCQKHYIAYECASILHVVHAVVLCCKKKKRLSQMSLFQRHRIRENHPTFYVKTLRAEVEKK